MTATWADTEMRDQVEHECPQPLRYRAEEFAIGGMVYTPAGRWETVAEATVNRSSWRVVVRTDRATWRFAPAAELPYLPPYLVGFGADPVRVVVNETDSTIVVYVTRGRGFYRDHVLITAARAKGGWQIVDHPDGAASEQLGVDSRAKARTEIRRRAKAHAKRLGLPYAPAEPRS
jgi:hypothetical protein